MNPWKKLERLLYPPKCVLCGELLSPEETDLCHGCRLDTPECNVQNVKLPHLAHWTALWYYEEKVKKGIHRFKFSNHRGMALSYGRLLAMKLMAEDISFDVLSWVPISSRRLWSRGYDQGKLLAQAVGKELSVKPQAVLRKRRNNSPQSTLGDAAQRRANVLGAYRCTAPELVQGKRILLIDDVLTTGATAGECARVLLSAGAAAVSCATVAAANHQHKNSR